MSGPFGSHNFMTKGAPPEGGQSLRFNDDDSAYLSWTPAAAGNRKTWTWSGWVKRGNLPSSVVYLFGNSNGTNRGFHVTFTSNHTLDFLNYPSGVSGQLTTTRVFRDTNAWYHIVLVWDTTDATSGDRMRVYINGVRETDFGTSSYPSLNLDGTWNSTSYGNHAIGRNNYNGRYFDGYMAEVNFVDGTALDPTSFGETDANGQWVPIKEPSVTYGTNGFYLPFTNDYEVEGFNTVTYRGNGADQYIGGVGFEPDFLWVKDRTAAYNHILVNSVVGVTNFLNSNTTNTESSTAGYITSTETDGFSLGSGGNVNASGNSYVAWAWDMGTVENLVTNGDFDQDISGWSTTQGTVTWDSGRRAYLQGPSGVTFRQTITGLDVSKTYYYTASLSRTSGTGNFGVDVDGTLDYVAGSSYTNYTASGFFTPSSSSIVFDVWGGSGLYLYADDIQIFEANTDGSITSSVKASQTYGQSIVSYTGNGVTSGESIGHGLSQRPDMVIIKNRDNGATGWNVLFPEFMTATQYLALNLTSAISNSANSGWGGSLPDSTKVYVGGSSWTNTSGNDYIAYCFHSVAGYSDFGSYTGTGVAGNTVTTGFEPAFVMIKKTNSFGNWYIYDNLRGINRLQADQSDADYSQDNVKFLSDGFELTSTASGFNGNGSTYIYMAFADKREAAFWLDQSGNNNDWTNNNMQESDISLDSPTNNFATLNALDKSSAITLSEGNLSFTHSTLGHQMTSSTIAVNSGKWYIEVVLSNLGGTYSQIGISPSSSSNTTFTGDDGYAYLYNGNKSILGTGSSYGSSYTTGDIIGIAFDADSGSITFYKNGVSQGVAATGIDTSIYWRFSVSTFNIGTGKANFGQDSSFAGNEVAQGNTDENGFGDFYYAPPAGYLALCTQNLPDPAIADGSEHFNTVLYTGNGSTQSITGVGFQPDFTWIKVRSTTNSHYLFDQIRGADQALFSDTTSVETDYSSTGRMTSFDTDGFTVKYSSSTGTNASSNTYAAWNWKAGGTGVANTDGTISSTVSANPTAGFSIVGWTGTGAVGTIGHGLASAPELIIAKNRTDAGTEWLVYHAANTSAPETDYLQLNNTAATVDNANVWNDTAPTSSVFSVGSSAVHNGSGDNIISYCFHSVEGYSKFGSYTGSGSSDGPFVYTGFRPAFVIYKRTDAAAVWVMHDTVRDDYNAMTKRLYPNQADAEANSSTYAIDALSNGFKVRSTLSTVNASGGTYIYMAFAENPFKYSNAR